MPAQRKPSYQSHKGSGQAKVRINGRDHYLGPYGSSESREKYDELIGEWLACNGDTSRHNLTVDDLVLLFLDFAESYYRRENGEPTGETRNMRDALRPLIRLYGSS